MTSRWAQQQSSVARRFFGATLLQAAVSGGLAALMIRLTPVPPPSGRLQLPAAFAFGTLFLLAGSWFLQSALAHVRRERQRLFRNSLLLALVSAVLFVGFQSGGLWGFVRSTKNSFDPQRNVHGFAFAFTALHVMHFLVAQSVLMWVTICAFMDRYDHEYYWGVTFAAWLWHLLGIAWLMILCVFFFAYSTGFG